MPIKLAPAYTIKFTNEKCSYKQFLNDVHILFEDGEKISLSEKPHTAQMLIETINSLHEQGESTHRLVTVIIAASAFESGAIVTHDKDEAVKLCVELAALDSGRMFSVLELNSGNTIVSIKFPKN